MEEGQHRSITKQAINDLGQHVDLHDFDQPVVSVDEIPVWWNQRWHHPGVSPRSVASRIPPRDWNPEQAIRFEVSLEILDFEVNACTGRIAHERAQPHPDQTMIERCRARRKEIAHRRLSLRSDDPAAIELIFRDAAEPSIGPLTKP